MDKIKAFLFDLDGVLVSTEYNHFLAWQRCAHSLDIAFTEKENERLKGVSRADSLKLILELGNKPISHSEFEALLKSKNDFYLESIQSLNQAHLLPGVLPLLIAAKNNGILLGVGSSSKNANFILDKLDISQYFEVIIDGNGVKDPKPHPEVFLNGAKALGLHPSACLVFEDAASGIAAAKAGGFTAVGVGNPHIAAEADIYLNDLTEFRVAQYA